MRSSRRLVVIVVESGAATSAGRRSLNEDDFVASAPVFVVADGMGGHSAGEVASGIAVDEFKKLVRLQTVQPIDVVRALDRANDQILLRTEQDPGRAGMGTTIAALIALKTGGLDHWFITNVGDSRVYRFAGRRLQQLTVDHSEVEELVESGAISRDDARVHPRRNIITRSLGTDPPPVAEHWLLPPSVGERFLLCSDGLVDELPDGELVAQLSQPLSPQEIADELIKAAVSAGGRDNVTVVVVDVRAVTDPDADGDTVPRTAVSS